MHSLHRKCLVYCHKTIFNIKVTKTNYQLLIHLTFRKKSFCMPTVSFYFVDILNIQNFKQKVLFVAGINREWFFIMFSKGMFLI